MKQFITEYYGDNTRWFVATVIDGSPPIGLEGRVKIRVHGIHSENVNDIPQSDLPWAQVMMPGNMFGVSGFGGNCQLMPGALVFGIFLDGKASQLPFVMGSIPKVEFPTSVQAQGRDDPSTNPYVYDIRQQSVYGIERTSYENVNTLSLERKREVAMKFFIDNGFRPGAAAGIVGNLQTVSDLDSTLDDGQVSGIAAWEKRSPRWKRYVDYSGRFFQEQNIEDFEVQLTYILLEMRSNKSIVVSKLNSSDEIGSTYNGVRTWNNTQNSGTSEIFRNFFFSKATREGYTDKFTSYLNSVFAYNTIWE